MDPAKVKEFESLQVLPEIKHVVKQSCLSLTLLRTCNFMNFAIMEVHLAVFLSGFCGILPLLLVIEPAIQCFPPQIELCQHPGHL